MFGDGSQTPSRFELLSMVKKHSKLLGKTTVDQEDSSDVEMDPRFWHDVLNLYFLCSKEARGRQDDDMLFFVRKMGLYGYGANGNVEGDSPFFVRRWAPKLDELVGDRLVEVDWRRSFYLNLIAHTSFSIQVGICSHQMLQNYQSGQCKSLCPIYKVVKTVYASPSRINFHLDSRKEAETTAAYPDICFAVDDFDSTFDAVVLTDADHCYCVVLNANDGAAFPCENSPQNSPRDTSSVKIGTNAGEMKSSKITLFSGFVSYQMVRDAYDAGRSGFGSFLSLAQSPGKADRLYMKGPGGRGEVEVAVSSVVDQSKEELSHHPGRGFGIGRFVRRAASVASVAAKHAYAAASATRISEEEMLPLKCCLMSVSLPWEHIAHDLLFKQSPAVNF